MAVDLVRHPPHYAEGGWPFECIDLTRLLPFCLGNAVKYVWRHRDKGNPLEDLKKAVVYLEWAIEDALPIYNYDRACRLALEFRAEVIIRRQEASLTRDEAEVYLAIPEMVYGADMDLATARLERAISRAQV